MSELDRVDAQAKYRQIAARLRAAIRAGQFPAGSFVPSQGELMREYGVALTTARNALLALAAEGLIEAQGTRGYQVRQQRPVRHWVADYVGGRSHSQWYAQLRSEGKTPSEELRGGVRRELADPDVALRLQLEPDAQVVVRERLVSIDGEPYELAKSFYPLPIAQGTKLEEPRKIKGGAAAVLVDLGWTIVDFDDEVSMGPTSSEDVRKALKLGASGGAIRIWRTAFATSPSTEEPVPVELTEILLAADRHALHYRVSAREPVAEQEESIQAARAKRTAEREAWARQTGKPPSPPSGPSPPSTGRPRRP